MKRTRYDSDYDRIRREAGLDRPLFDFPAQEPAPVALARIEAAHEDFRRRMAELSRIEAEQAAKRKAAADALSRRANDSVLRWEYERAGLIPPIPGDDGRPAVSLSLLRSLGWTVEQVGEQRTLVAPPAAKTNQERHRRQDYEGST